MLTPTTWETTITWQAERVHILEGKRQVKVKRKKEEKMEIGKVSKKKQVVKLN